MANSVITQYLSDTSIPAEIRRNIASGLNKGDLTEDAAVAGITSKYGNKYGSSSPSGMPSMPQASQSDQGAPSAPKISGGWNTRDTAPEDKAPLPQMPTQIPQPQAGQAPGSQFPKPWDPNVGESIASSPIGKFVQEQVPKFQEALSQEAQQGPLERAGNVLKQAGGGVLNTLGGLGNAIYGGTGAAFLNPLDQRSAQEKSELGIKGLNQAIGGVGQVVSSPLAISPTAQKAFSLPFEAVRSTIDNNIVKAAGIDPESEHGKNITDSLMNALTIAVAGPENIAEGLTKATEIPGKISESIKSIGKSTEQRIAKYQQNIDQNVAKIAQGKSSDIATAKNALGEIDTQGIKTYKDLSKSIGDKINVLKKNVDEKLQQDTTKYTPEQFDKTYSQGKSSIQSNPIKDALAQLGEMYQAIKSPKDAVRIQDLTDKFNTEGLNLKDLNDVAREYGTQFGKKAFGKNGEPLTSVNAQAFENTRSGVKDAVREKLPDNQTQILDEKMHDLIRAKDLSEKMVEKVNALKQKVQDRSLGEKLGGTVANIVDKGSLGTLKGFFSKFIPRNVGLKTLNSLDLEASLSKAFSTIDKLSSQIETLKNAPAKAPVTLGSIASKGKSIVKNAAKASATTQE